MNPIYASDIPRVFTALAEWCACFIIIAGKYPRRFNGLRLWQILGLGLAIQCAFLHLTGALPLPLWLPCMALAVGLMLALIAVCCAIPMATACYCTVRAFLLAELAASLEWQLYSYVANTFLSQAPGARYALAILFLAAVYLPAFSLMYWLENRRADPMTALSFQLKELWSPVFIGAACFLMSNLSFVTGNTPFSSSIANEIYNIRTLVDLAGVAMLYAYHVQRCELYMQQELNAIQSILQNQYVQYQQSRESIDVINRKYHDLKHQIAVLRAEPDADKRSAYLDGMEDEIRDYEAQNKTGNSVLDTVLTSKNLYCARHGVELTCVADGARLGFMDVMDICTIFGNVLDNAIECELRIPEREKRLIHLAVYGKKDFLVIQCGNYCQEELKFQGGLPLSTKGDSAYHGYGIKSVRQTAEKYGGTLTIHNRDGWFEINIMIPRQDG